MCHGAIHKERLRDVSRGAKTNSSLSWLLFFNESLFSKIVFRKNDCFMLKALIPTAFQSQSTPATACQTKYFPSQMLLLYLSTAIQIRANATSPTHQSPMHYKASHRERCHEILTRGTHRAKWNINPTQTLFSRVSMTQHPVSFSSLSQMFLVFRFCQEVEVIPRHLLQETFQFPLWNNHRKSTFSKFIFETYFKLISQESEVCGFTVFWLFYSVPFSR